MSNQNPLDTFVGRMNSMFEAQTRILQNHIDRGGLSHNFPLAEATALLYGYQAAIDHMEDSEIIKFVDAVNLRASISSQLNKIRRLKLDNYID